MENVGGETWGLVMQVVKVGSTPAGLAIMLSMMLTQLLKSFDHVILREDLTRGQIRSASWLATVLTFPLLCWVMGIDVRTHIALGFVAGFISPMMPWFLKKVGIDVDKMTGHDAKSKRHRKRK